DRGDGGAAAAGGVPVAQAHAGRAGGRRRAAGVRRGVDAFSRAEGATGEGGGDEDGSEPRGGEAAGGAREGGGDHARRVRPWRVPVPWSRGRVRGGCPRGWTRVLGSVRSKALGEM